MAESTIITGQFVRISQTPASIGERLMALIIDYFLIGLYILSTITLLSKLSIPSGFSLFFFLCIVYLPILGYSFLLRDVQSRTEFWKETHQYPCCKSGRFHSQHRILSVTMDSFSQLMVLSQAYLGLLVILLNKNNQRLGDLAAGTMVIKEKNYRKIHVSLDEFDYLTQNYHPVYPQSADLSLEQVNVITRTLESSEKDRARRVTALAKKVQELLSVTPRDGNQEKISSDCTSRLSVLCIGGNITRIRCFRLFRQGIILTIVRINSHCNEYFFSSQ